MASDTTEWTYQPVPVPSQRLYRMAWQLESWLRMLVYVELRAAFVAWETPLTKHAKQTPRFQENDKRLHHMTTSHESALSYMSFGELWNVISDDETWPLFEAYFPPKDNVKVRIAEVLAIRNRVAHFREPHQHDEERFALFMKDMEPGIRQFCNRYTYTMAPSVRNDPVTARLAATWEEVGYGIELNTPDHGWVYAPSPNTADPLFHADLKCLLRPGTRDASSGMIYQLSLMPRTGKGVLNVVDFLRSTARLHKDVIHILVRDDIFGVSVTIPAVHGVDRATELVVAYMQSGLNCSRSLYAPSAASVRSEWPEYVLWPDHMLTFFDDECCGPVLDLS